MCAEIKELVDFYKDASKPNGYEYKCKECSDRRRDKRLGTHGARYKQLRLKYGVTKAQVEALHRAQGGKCAGCGTVADEPHMQLDHDHVTGKVRGLLCGLCNCALAMVRDRPDTLRTLADYVEKPRTAG